MAGPKDALRGRLQKIHDKQFMPDSTRSGRRAPAANGEAPARGNGRGITSMCMRNADEGIADYDGRRGI
eukprot:9648962-Heterocapsa_arctica.AAC.1